jgi:hypothetical protein
MVQKYNSRGLDKSWPPGRRDDKSLYDGAQYLGVLSVRLAL